MSQDAAGRAARPAASAAPPTPGRLNPTDHPSRATRTHTGLLGGDDAPEAPVLSTLANGLAVLEQLAHGRSGARQLAERVGLPRQTTYRLLRTLVADGWVDLNRADDTYSLTSKVWSIASRSFRLGDVRDMLGPRVRQLAEVHGETVHLATYERGNAVYIDKADGWHPIRSYSELGGTAPAYCVATGKMLLSLQPAAELARVLAQPLETYTERTLTDPAKLRTEIEQCRTDGFAVNRCEWRDGVAGLAVALGRGPTGQHIAIGFSGPEARIMARFDELLSALRDVAEDSPLLLPISSLPDSMQKGTT